MGIVKDAMITAFEESADRLEKITGKQEIPLDFREAHKKLTDPNFKGKWKLAWFPDVLRNLAKKFRWADVKQGDWPPFGPKSASMAMEIVERLGHEAQARSADAAFVKSVKDALRPIEEVVREYGTETNGEWLFAEEEAEPVPAFEPPPAARS